MIMLAALLGGQDRVPGSLRNVVATGWTSRITPPVSPCPPDCSLSS